MPFDRDEWIAFSAFSALTFWCLSNTYSFPTYYGEVIQMKLPNLPPGWALNLPWWVAAGLLSAFITLFSQRTPVNTEYIAIVVLWCTTLFLTRLYNWILYRWIEFIPAALIALAQLGCLISIGVLTSIHGETRTYVIAFIWATTAWFAVVAGYAVYLAVHLKSREIHKLAETTRPMEPISMKKPTNRQWVGTGLSKFR
jgi:hypothetical protein